MSLNSTLICGWGCRSIPEIARHSAADLKFCTEIRIQLADRPSGKLQSLVICRADDSVSSPPRYLNWGADLTGKSKNAVVNKSEPGWSPFGINRVEMLEK